MSNTHDKGVDPRVVSIVMQAIGRIQGSFLYSREEAIDEALRVLGSPVKRGGKISAYRKLDVARPWSPGDAKPERV